MSQKARDYPVRIGAAGWEHPAWSGAFYPGDLPPEWRLAYYANAFPVVLMPAARLAAATAEELADWRELADTGFRVLVEASSSAVDDRLLGQMKALGETAGGWVLAEEAGKALESALAALADSGLPVAIEGGKNLVKERISEPLGRVWRGEGPAAGLEAGALAVIRVPTEGADPRRLRGWLETGLAVQDGQRDVILILEGAPPSLEVLEQARILLELL